MGERRVIRLAGLEWGLERFPDPLPLPAFWAPFEFREQLSPAAGVISLTTGPCPIAPSGPPINANRFFHIFRTPDGAGFLGCPVPEVGWRALCWPARQRIELYIAGTPDPGTVGTLVDQTFWRFRSLIMAPADRLVMHAAAAMHDGRVLVLAGDTGRGKSTLARLLHEAGWTILSDESPFVEAPANGPIRVWGSPWPSSDGFASAGSGILAGLYLIEHGSANKITPIEPGLAVRRLLNERLFLCPLYEDGSRDRLLAVVDRMLLGAPCAVLAFKPDAEVTALLRKDE